MTDATDTVTVTWIHPSVRDRVITHLMTNEAARRSFLVHAEVDGLMLALSDEGGAEGDRRLPFLRDDDDWAAITERFGGLPGEAWDRESARLLSLLERISQLATDEDTEPATRGHLKEIITAALERLRNHWDRNHTDIQTSSLRAFYRASTSIAPPARGPDLRQVWERAINRIRAFNGPGSPDDLEVIGAGSNWHSLASTLSQFDPRWLAYFVFPDAYEAEASLLIDKIDAAVVAFGEPEITDEDDPEEFEDSPPDTDWIPEAEALLDELAQWFPSLQDRCKSLAARASNLNGTWASYSERHESLLEPEDEDRWWRDDPDYDEFAEDERTEVFDIEEFFSDL